MPILTTFQRMTVDSQPWRFTVFTLGKSLCIRTILGNTLIIDWMNRPPIQVSVRSVLPICSQIVNMRPQILKSLQGSIRQPWIVSVERFEFRRRPLSCCYPDVRLVVFDVVDEELVIYFYQGLVEWVNICHGVSDTLCVELQVFVGLKGCGKMNGSFLDIGKTSECVQDETDVTVGWLLRPRSVLHRFHCVVRLSVGGPFCDLIFHEGDGKVWYYMRCPKFLVKLLHSSPDMYHVYGAIWMWRIYLHGKMLNFFVPEGPVEDPKAQKSKSIKVASWEEIL